MKVSEDCDILALETTSVERVDLHSFVLPEKGGLDRGDHISKDLMKMSLVVKEL